MCILYLKRTKGIKEDFKGLLTIRFWCVCFKFQDLLIERERERERERESGAILHIILQVAIKKNI